MCRVHKFSELTNSNTNPYVFKSFTNQNNMKCDESEPESSLNEVPKEYYNNIEMIEHEIEILQKQADSIISNAKMEANKIVERANHEAVDVLNSSSIEGYKKGLSMANEKIEETIRVTNLKAIEILENAKANSDKIVCGLEEDILNFSLDIAKKILNVEIDRNDEIFLSIVKKALKKIKTDTTAKIIMQADDFKRLQDRGADKVFTNGKQTNLQFVVDRDMKKGDIIIETDRGTMDAGVNAQFSKLKSALVQEKISAI